MDTVKVRQDLVGTEKDLPLLETAETCWINQSDFREQGDRAVEFTYGDQWADRIRVNGEVMTTREYCQRMGNIVLQTNQIKNKVETIVGVMVKEKNEPICNARDRDEQQYGEVMTTALQANCNKNKMEALYIKWMKDLCIRGLAASHESYDYRHGRFDSWTDYCEPNCMFFDSEMTDPRFWDIHLIGQFFDCTPENLAARFAKTPEDYARLKDMYPSQFEPLRAPTIAQITDKRDESTVVFRTPYDLTKCRVFEIWTKETKARIRLHDWNNGTEEVVDADDSEYRKRIRRENESRQALAVQAGIPLEDVPFITGDGYGRDDEEKTGFFIDEFWYCHFLAPDGSIIWEGESPYPGRMHPFSLVATPFVNGRIVGFMNDAIDHNIAINRAIILQDWLIRVQAKGVPVVPNKIVPNQDKKKFAKAWSSLDEIAFIDLKPGEEGLFPRIISGNQSNFNASELINTYKSLMEESLPVTGAMQGKTPYSGTSGTMYAQMAANSSTPIASLMSQFHNFLEDIHTKKMKNIAEFYTVDEFSKIAGKIDGIFDNANLNLNDVAHIEYDLSIRESTQTPVYRAIINDDAKQFLLQGLISMEEYLTIAEVPYADKLLQQRQARQAEMQAAQQGQMPARAIEEAWPNQNAPLDISGNPLPRPSNVVPQRVL